MAKQKTSPSNALVKKRIKFSGSSQKESYVDIPSDSGHHLIPPIHSFEVPFGVSKTHSAPTHRESAHELPPPLKMVMSVTKSLVVPWDTLMCQLESPSLFYTSII